MDKKITALTSATSLTGPEVLPVVQSGANKKSTVQLIVDLVMSGLADVASSGDYADLSGAPVVMMLVAAPTTATDPAVAGSIAYDANYIYIAVATNTWKRVAISTF